MNSLVSSLRQLRATGISHQVRGITGIVKFFNPKKGWGIILTQDTPPKEVFVHQSAIHMDGFRYLEQNQEVSFEIQQSERGPQAANVKSTKAEQINRADL